MTFLRVIIGRKDSEKDERNDTVKDFPRTDIDHGTTPCESQVTLFQYGYGVAFWTRIYFTWIHCPHQEIYFYIVVPKRAKLLVEKQMLGFYPDALIEETDEINIFEGT
jgi:hypothetical protein